MKLKRMKPAVRKRGKTNTKRMRKMKPWKSTEGLGCTRRYFCIKARCVIANQCETHYFASQGVFNTKAPQFYETGALEKHILENDAKLRPNTNATVLLQVSPFDPGLYHKMCLQASTFISNAVQNVETHNSLRRSMIKFFKI